MTQDWRITNQSKYLKGVELFWKKYTKYSESWDHDHCDFCWVKFSKDLPETLQSGFTTKDNYYWICEKCYKDFKSEFKWIVNS